MEPESNAQHIESQYVQHQDLLSILYAYPLISLLMMAINLYFIVHALRTGRPYYWVWIIFAMPVLGAAAYFFVEMRPALSMRKLDWDQLRWQFASPAYRIGRLQELVNDSPTVKNQCRLASEYESQGMWAEAAQRYRDCLSGVFANDAKLQILLSSALIEQGNASESLKFISQVSEQRDSKLEEERKLALYRAQSSIGEHDSAIAGLESIAKKTYSFAPRYYLAQAKLAAGRVREASDDAHALLHSYRRGNALLRRSEKVWFGKAKQLVKANKVA